MQRTGHTIALGLLSLALAGSAGAREHAGAPTAQAAGPQEVEVVAVTVDARSQTPVVVLQGKRDGRRLAMTIGFAEATGIALPLQGVTPPRPLTHDLFLTLFGRLHVSVSRAVITDLRDDTYFATLYLKAGSTEMTLDSRPSDAIALAVRAKAPVLVEDRVFDKSGADPAPPRPHI